MEITQASCDTYKVKKKLNIGMTFYTPVLTLTLSCALYLNSGGDNKGDVMREARAIGCSPPETVGV